MMDSHDGMTMDRYLGERGPLDPGKVLRLAVQLAQQIGAESAAQVISPSRILVTRTGTVRLLPPPAEDLALPTIVEFPAYASPEEIRGEQPDVRSTLYSLGCTLYELLTGSPPYSGSSPRAVLRAHVEEPVPDVRQRTPGVSPALGETIIELLEKDPSLRIQSPDELTRRLRQAGLHSPAAAPPPAAPAATSTARGRGRGPIALGDSARGSAARGSAGSGSTKPGRAPAPSSRLGSGSARGRLAAARAGGARSTAPRSGGPPRPGKRGGLGKRDATQRRGKARDPYDFDEGFEDEPQGPVVVRRKSYPFTIGGAVLGLLIGLAIVISKMQQAKTVPTQEQEALVEESAEALSTRKKAFAEELKSQKETIDQLVVRLQRMPEERRRDFLAEALNAHATLPGAYRLAKPLYDMGPPETRERPGTSGDSSAPAYEDLMTRARQLHEAGKLGPAYMLLVDEGRPFESEHGDEMNQLIEKWSDELTLKWERDKERIDQLALQGDGDGAIRVCRNAMAYGDSQIIKEANRKVESIQGQLDIQRSLEDSATAETGSDELDLDAELEELRSEGKDAGSETEKAADDLEDLDLGNPFEEL